MKPQDLSGGSLSLQIGELALSAEVPYLGPVNVRQLLEQALLRRAAVPGEAGSACTLGYYGASDPFGYLGYRVESIADLANGGPEGRYWVFLHNERAASAGIDNTWLEPGDTVTWLWETLPALAGILPLS